ncbi:Pentatricopeptide repeat-containing protein At2g20540 [Linum perenne]
MGRVTGSSLLGTKVLKGSIGEASCKLLQERFISVLQSCKTFKHLLQFLSQVVTNGFHRSEHIMQKVIVECGLLKETEYARKLFDEIPYPSVSCWNAMFRGYYQNSSHREVIVLFGRMKSLDIMPNSYSFPVVLKSCVKVNALCEGEELHCVVIKSGFKSNPFVGNTVLNGYANNGDIEACERFFEEMPERNIFSWNGLLGGFAHNGCFPKVISTFKRMLAEKSVTPNNATFVTVLSACARLGALDLGRWIHVNAKASGYKENLYVGNALIDMYAKCGVMESAVDVFRSMKRKDLISWNTMICGLAAHGHGADALNMFTEMKDAGERPDAITFTGILSGCVHMGFVHGGFSYFHSMIDDYSIEPRIEHYGCMVDLLARAGLLAQAVDFIFKMPIEADAVMWATLLAACRVYKNVEFAELALGKLVEFNPKNPANYVMLSNVYGDVGRWKDLARLKVAMRDTGFKKMPGSSSIEINDVVSEFYSLDERHANSQQIHETLKGLTRLSRLYCHVPERDADII